LSGAFWESGQVKRRIVQGIRPRDSASGLGNSPALRRRDMDIKLIFNDFWGLWPGMTADRSGLRPRDSASGLGNSPPLRRQDMDIKLIFNGLRQTLDW